MCRDIASCKCHLRGISHSRHSLRLLVAADNVFDEQAMSPIGPKRHFAATQQTVADEPTADIALPSESRIYQRGVGTTPSFFCRLDDDVVY